MSRIGKNPVTLPDGVNVTIVNQTVTAKGKLGELTASFTDDVEITQDGNVVTVSSPRRRPAR